MLCQCGCGEKAPIAERTDKRKGWTKGQPKRYIAGHYKPQKKEKIKVEEKICAECGTLKPSTDFNKNNSHIDGLASWCKECNKRNMKKWTKENVERKKELNKRDYKRNKDKYLERAVKQRIEQPLRKRVNTINDRARIEHNDTNKITLEQYIGRLEMFGYKCWICRKPYEGMDHVKPYKKGGRNFASNIRPICRKCNGRKEAHWYGVDGLQKYKNGT